MPSEEAADEIREIVEALGIEISDGDGALFAIGRLDALASATVDYYSLGEQVTTAASPPGVFRQAAKREQSKERAKALRAAARKASDLLKIAEEVSYGELHEGGVRRAERIRSQLYELLYDDWALKLQDED